MNKRTLATLGTVLGAAPLRRIVLALLIFTAAEVGTWVAVLVYAYNVGGGGAVGIAAAAQLVPAALAAPVLASLLSRLGRRRALRLGYGAQAIADVSTGLAMVSGLPLPLVLAFAIVAAMLATTGRPLHSSYLPELTQSPDELIASNVASSAAEATGMFLGPALAGLVMAWRGPGEAFLVLGVALAGAVLLVSGLETAPPAKARNGDKHARPLGGFRILAANRNARVLVGVKGAQDLVNGGLDVLLVVVAVDTLGWGEEGAGYLNSALGAGMLLGAAAAGVLVGRRKLGGAVMTGALGSGAALAASSIAPIGAALLVPMVGAGHVYADTAARTLLQRVARGPTLLQVFGIMEGQTMAALAVGSLLASLGVSTLGVAPTLVAFGACLPIVVVLGWVGIRRADSAAQVPVEQLALLRAYPMFAPLPPPILEGLAFDLVAVSVAAGEVVVRQGEEGDCLYVVADGEMVVTGDDREIARLGPGEAFGEIALLYDVPRTATVTAVGPGRLYTLARDRFLRALGVEAAARSVAEDVAGARLRQTRGEPEDL